LLPEVVLRKGEKEKMKFLRVTSLFSDVTSRIPHHQKAPPTLKELLIKTPPCAQLPDNLSSKSGQEERRSL